MFDRSWRRGWRRYLTAMGSIALALGAAWLIAERWAASARLEDWIMLGVLAASVAVALRNVEA
jgi:uncharacterized membrane protein